MGIIRYVEMNKIRVSWIFSLTLTLSLSVYLSIQLSISPSLSSLSLPLSLYFYLYLSVFTAPLSHSLSRTPSFSLCLSPLNGVELINLGVLGGHSWVVLSSHRLVLLLPTLSQPSDQHPKRLSGNFFFSIIWISYSETVSKFRNGVNVWKIV